MLRELNKPRVEIESIEKLEKKSIVKKIHELVKDSNIELTIESKRLIVSTATSISNKQNLRIKPIVSSFKDKCIAYYPELPCRKISPPSYLNIET